MPGRSWLEIHRGISPGSGRINRGTHRNEGRGECIREEELDEELHALPSGSCSGEQGGLETATLKQDQGSEMTPTCAELIDTSVADAPSTSLSMTQKKGCENLHRGRIFRWTDDHLRLTNVKRSQAAERQTQSAKRIDVHPFRFGSPSIYCNHDAPNYMCEASPTWNPTL